MRARFYVSIGALSLIKQSIRFYGVRATESVTLSSYKSKY